MHYLNVELKIIHSDLKAKNVFLNREHDGRLVAIIGDFGIATNISLEEFAYNSFGAGSYPWMVC
jgi:serine/threonine protein kinase